MTIWTKLCLGEAFRLCERVLERSSWFKGNAMRCDSKIMEFRVDVPSTSFQEYEHLLEELLKFNTRLYHRLLLNYPVLCEVKDSPNRFWFQYPGTLLFVPSNFIKQERTWQFSFFLTAIRYKRLCKARIWNPPLRLLRIQLMELLHIRRKCKGISATIDIDHELMIRLTELMRCGSHKILTSSSTVKLIQKVEQETGSLPQGKHR